MSSRYPVYKKFDYCLNPVRISTPKGFSYVPCGRCDGCSLHKANVWSQRLSAEIDNSSHTLFFTLTYDNHYLPYLVKCSNLKDRKVYWISDHGANIRFNGKKDVPRKDGISIRDYNFDSVPVTNLDGSIIPYCSKNDIQLFFKIVRKNLIYYGTTVNSFRYFCISEYGETRFRPHEHVLIFCNDEALSKVLQSSVLFESWKMCNKTRFIDYCTFADSGASSYVTQYLTCNSLLPKVYQLCKEIQPFRLSSKRPAIGYNSFDESIFEKIAVGNLEYDRIIERIDKRYVLRYSSDFIASLFPKCSRFSLADYRRLYSVYGFLLCATEVYNRLPFRTYYDFTDVLRAFLPSSDWRAAYVASRFCRGNRRYLSHYLYLLDMVYYKMSMYALKKQYESMQDKPMSFSWFGCYTNLPELVSNYFALSCNVGGQKDFIEYFFEPFGLSPIDLVGRDLYDWYPKPYDDNYISELHSILEDMVKLPKFNELAGTAPQLNV